MPPNLQTVDWYFLGCPGVHRLKQNRSSRPGAVDPESSDNFHYPTEGRVFLTDPGRGHLMNYPRAVAGSTPTPRRWVSMTYRDQYERIRDSHLGKALDNYSFPAAIANSDYRLVYLNPDFTQAYGWRLEEVLGLNSAILVTPDTATEKLQSARKRTSTPPAGWEGTIPQMTRDRKVKHACLKLIAVKSPIDPAGLFRLWLMVEEGQIREAEGVLLSLLCASLLVSEPNPEPEKPGKGWMREATRKEVRRLTDLGFRGKEIAALVGISDAAVRAAQHRIRKEGPPCPTPALLR